MLLLHLCNIILVLTLRSCDNPVNIGVAYFWAYYSGFMMLLLLGLLHLRICFNLCSYNAHI
jgi:hypothetical protein